MWRKVHLGLRFISDLPLTRGLHYSLIFVYIFAPICLHNLYLPALNLLLIPGSLAFADSQFFQFYSSQRNCIFSTSVFLSFTLQSNMILTSLLPLSCIADRFLITLYLRVLHLFILSSWNSCKLLFASFPCFLWCFQSCYLKSRCFHSVSCFVSRLYPITSLLWVFMTCLNIFFL